MMRRSSLVWLTGLAFVVGCLDRDLAPLNPCVVSGVVVQVKAQNIDKVDLLFVIDNSGSMSEEQASLIDRLEPMVQVLTSGDRDNDGTVDFPPVADLHVGVVSTDMGAGGYPGHCPVVDGLGDDGVLQNTSSGEAGCLPEGQRYPVGVIGPDFLSYIPESDPRTPAEFAGEFACIARLGTMGCGLEQQLDAMLKAVVPSTSGINFVGGTVGHGDTTNAGFLRDDSLLAVIMVTDEDDCSAVDTRIFDTSDTNPYPGHANNKCALAWDNETNRQALWPIDRYTNGMLALRPGSPDLVVFAAITGVPANLVENPDSIDYDAILASDPMQIEVDMSAAANGTRLVPSCSDPDRGVAFPPRRIVETAKAFEDAGSNGIIQSICQADFTPALNAILAKIADVLGGACLPRALNRNSQGLVDCDVVEILPAEMNCADLAASGREADPVRFESDGREVCRVIQRAAPNDTVPGEPGWYYDDFTQDVLDRCDLDMDGANAQRVSFVPGAEPLTGVTVRLECLQPVVSSAGPLTIQVGTPCDPGMDPNAPNDSACDGTLDNLICDVSSRTCQQACTSTADCAGGLVCDDITRTRPVCQNPTCPTI